MLPYEAKKWFEVEENKYDFTRLPLPSMQYDEEVVRFNINKVQRPNNIVVVAPSFQKEKVVVEPVDFVDRNKTGMREVAEINKKRYELIQQQKQNRSTMSLSRASARTKASSTVDQSVIENNLMTPRSLKLKMVRSASANRHGKAPIVRQLFAQYAVLEQAERESREMNSQFFRQSESAQNVTIVDTNIDLSRQDSAEKPKAANFAHTPSTKPLKADWKVNSSFINSALVSDRLNFLASRENTVIDNPYHNSHIARVFNFIRDETRSQTLRQD